MSRKSKVEQLYEKTKQSLIDSKEVDFFEDSGISTVTFTEKSECLGCFEVIRGTPKIIVAVGGDKQTAYLTFLHEYMHFQQWRDKSALYAAEYLTSKEKRQFKSLYPKGLKVEINMVLDRWVKGDIELSEKQLRNFTKRTIMVEHDCERRVIELLKASNVPVKVIEDYAQQANTYLFKYLYQRKHRIWKHTGNLHKKFPKQLCPHEIFDLDLPEKYEQLIQDYIKRDEKR